VTKINPDINPNRPFLCLTKVPKIYIGEVKFSSIIGVGNLGIYM
jgi:hypothetical protein